MKYFVKIFRHGPERPNQQFMSGAKNPIYTEVFPNLDFGEKGYWLWLKNAALTRPALCGLL
jgi:hypothetical protein